MSWIIILLLLFLGTLVLFLYLMLSAAQDSIMHFRLRGDYLERQLQAEREFSDELQYRLNQYER